MSRKRVAAVTVLIGAGLGLWAPPAQAAGSATWVQLAPATHPGARYWAASAYHPTSQQLVVFGGYNEQSASFLNDTWTFNGSTWTHVIPAHSPTARDAAVIGLDPGSGNLILFGGENDVTKLADTWSWNGTDWTQLAPAHSPAKRAWAGMGPSPTTSQPILFGGLDTTSFADTWTWNGSDWTQVGTLHSPPARLEMSMTPDPVHQKLVMFGGSLWDNTGELAQYNETWVFDGNDWTRAATTGPSPRAHPQAAYDPRLGRVVLFGGYDYAADADFQDTWSWTGAAWAIMSPTAKPSKRDSGAMAYLPLTGQLVLFGGYVTSGTNAAGTTLGDTWVLRMNPVTGSPALSTTTSALQSFGVTWGAPGVPTAYVIQYARKVKNSTNVWVWGPWTAWKTTSGTTLTAAFPGAAGNSYLFRSRAIYSGGVTTGWSPNAFTVVPYDDRSGVVSTGWTRRAAAGHYLSTETDTTLSGRTMTFSTSMHVLTIIGAKCATCGKFRVYVDNVLVATVDSYRSATALRQPLYARSFTGTATHSVRIVTLATTGRPKVVIDAFGVQR
jgi:hypothetical protein